MARRKNRPREERKPEPKPEVVEVPEKENEPRRMVPKARRCPACWTGLGGVGKRMWQTQINGPLKRRGYRCNQCGATWQAEVRTHIDEQGVEWVTTEIGKVERDEEPSEA